MLSDSLIRDLIEHKQLVIDPFPDDIQFQPASIDLRLGSQFKWFRERSGGSGILMHPEQPMNPELMMSERTVGDGDFFIMHSGQFVLATTLETVALGGQYAAQIEGRSSLGRLGIMVHVTAGFIDPGFHGQITLEIVNLSPYDMVLVPGMRVCQLSITAVDGLVRRPYGHPDLKSKYQNQQGIMSSKLGEDK